MREKLRAQVRDEVSAYGIHCDMDAADLLVRHLELVIEKNRITNLTRITDPATAVTLHIVDSLLPLAVKGLGIDRSDTMMDMGTGAGFPGIPLAIMTGCSATLVDSVAKKVNAVTEFIEALGLERTRAVHARLEDLARSTRHTQSRVVARAVAQTNVLIEYATPFLRDKGLLIVEKGRPSEEELEAAQRAAQLCGLALVSHEQYELPHDFGHRELLVYRKVAPSRVKLPRKSGEAKRNPLGL